MVGEVVLDPQKYAESPEQVQATFDRFERSPTSQTFLSELNRFAVTQGTASWFGQAIALSLPQCDTVTQSATREPPRRSPAPHDAPAKCANIMACHC